MIDKEILLQHLNSKIDDLNKKIDETAYIGVKSGYMNQIIAIEQIIEDVKNDKIKEPQTILSEMAKSFETSTEEFANAVKEATKRLYGDK